METSNDLSPIQSVSTPMQHGSKSENQEPGKTANAFGFHNVSSNVQDCVSQIPVVNGENAESSAIREEKPAKPVFISQAKSKEEFREETRKVVEAYMKLPDND